MSVFDGIKPPKVIFEVDSDHNGKITVLEVGHTRKLTVDGIVQSINWDSPAAEKMVWGKIVRVLKENEPELKSILILGLGGGTMQQLISKAFKDIHITSVELDPVMVNVAKEYFNVDSIPNHRIIVDDALRVMADPGEYGLAENSFGAVVIDIYCGEKYPELGRSGNFISGLLRIVIPGGLIVFNRIYLNHHQEEVNSFIEMVEEHLNDVKSLIIAGKTNSDNVLIFGRT